ncbi:hypothetical protein [Streptomyces sp. NPDC031705]|uniref:hypothetical protein n=1 Tax=Streptomyces sp. NPDC031705 TaxID=3155729 RepID=UPI0033D0C4CE
MTTSPHPWRVLREGSPAGGRPPGCVLAVDFGRSRSEAGFPELTVHLDPAYTVLETVPPALGVHDRRALSPETYTRGWAEALARRAEPVHAVLGYCMGAPLARAVAAGLAAHQASAPTVVLFDPELPGPETLLAQFAASVESLADELTGQEQEDALRHGREALDTRGPAALAAALADRYRDLALLAFTRAELGSELAAEAADRFDRYLAYLLAGAGTAASPSSPPHVAVTSATPGGAARYAERVRTFDVPRQDLLRHPGVGRALSELLRAPAQSPLPEKA